MDKPPNVILATIFKRTFTFYSRRNMNIIKNERSYTDVDNAMKTAF